MPPLLGHQETLAPLELERLNDPASCQIASPLTSEGSRMGWPFARLNCIANAHIPSVADPITGFLVLETHLIRPVRLMVSSTLTVIVDFIAWSLR
jgi:hypothetical protein